ncbi:rhodoquinone biosynthesis methyltransferase RquA [Inmirania thermothiophila]|uniref:Ubiquinone/menaquinone biosynthesis C-methylase UbiE n=1 Tax=Inmirania thermothiophila TaxID=1750597 RepID=A0A3N1Y951_9GAMM|nr:rhodoquinone biosynthesis methyltransferase RquA [Inmirania thermothiophila]ROR35028.1 ubiquinone/menaquinone biosynthesis C-methylase UbiE [Inmirania thermothiophila]
MSESTAQASATVPDYLARHYRWAYLTPGAVRRFDRPWVVNAILWGQYRRLARAAAACFGPGQRVLQAACVYGDLSLRIARRVGPEGRLDVLDAAAVQVRNARGKLRGIRWARVCRGDLTRLEAEGYDGALAFFLLHELPAQARTEVVARLLRALRPGGRAVFVDYHRPHPLHPLRPVMAAVFATLEPFAADLWQQPVEAFAPSAPACRWSQRTFFGGLYQLVIARRLPCGGAGAALD